MSETVSPRDIRDELDDVGIDTRDGKVAAEIQLNPLNLHAIAVGLGSENTVHEPERYPGVAYYSDVEATVLLFSNGSIVTVDAQDEDTAQTAIRSTLQRLESLGLWDGSTSSQIQVPAETLTIPEKRM